jgi:streptomycin 6-kinase
MTPGRLLLPREYDYANILMNLGKSMEKQLTMPKEQFERYRRSDVVVWLRDGCFFLGSDLVRITAAVTLKLFLWHREFLHYKADEDVYAIDADKEYDYANILMNLGKSMEVKLRVGSS